jgi:MFS family permease
MIKNFGVPTQDVAFYAGITAASFSFAQAFTGVLWGRASDKFGRKPAILLGLVGTLACLMLFGFSTSLPMAIAARSLSGIVNGNVRLTLYLKLYGILF